MVISLEGNIELAEPTGMTHFTVICGDLPPVPMHYVREFIQLVAKLQKEVADDEYEMGVSHLHQGWTPRPLRIGPQLISTTGAILSNMLSL